MGFWKLERWFSSWSKKDYSDMVFLYKEYVRETLEQREQERLERKQKVNTTLTQLGIVHTICNSLNN